MRIWCGISLAARRFPEWLFRCEIVTGPLLKPSLYGSRALERYSLERMKKPAFSIGKIAPTPGLVNQFFDDSTGTGDEGEIDTRGPWNEGGDWEFVSSPALLRYNGRQFIRRY